MNDQGRHAAVTTAMTVGAAFVSSLLIAIAEDAELDVNDVINDNGNVSVKNVVYQVLWRAFREAESEM